MALAKCPEITTSLGAKDKISGPQAALTEPSILKQKSERTATFRKQKCEQIRSSHSPRAKRVGIVSTKIYIALGLIIEIAITGAALNDSIY